MSTSASLSSLPDELLVGIAEYLVQTPQDSDLAMWREGKITPTPYLVELCFASQRLRRAVQPVLFSNITVKNYLQLLCLLRTLLEQPSYRPNIRCLRVGYGKARGFNSLKEYDLVMRTFDVWRDIASELPKLTFLTLQDVLHRIESLNDFNFIQGSRWTNYFYEPTCRGGPAHNKHCCRKRKETESEAEERYLTLESVLPIVFCLVPRVEKLSIVVRDFEKRPVQGCPNPSAPELDSVLAGLLGDDYTSSSLLPALKDLTFLGNTNHAGPHCRAFLRTLTHLRGIRYMSGILDCRQNHETLPFVSLDITTTPTRDKDLPKLLSACRDLKQLAITIEPYGFIEEATLTDPADVTDLISYPCPQLESLTVTQGSWPDCMVFEHFSLNSPLRFPKLRHLVINIFPDILWEFGGNRSPFNIGSVLPPSLEHLRMYDVCNSCSLAVLDQPEWAPKHGLQTLVCALISSWGTVAGAVRDGRLPSLKHGFFMKEEFGILPAQIAEVEDLKRRHGWLG